MQDKIKTNFGISINDDCLNVIKRMPSNYVDMVLTDPPYGINYQSNGRKVKMRRILNDDCNFRFSVYRELNIPETASATVALFNVRTTFYVLFATRNK